MSMLLEFLVDFHAGRLMEFGDIYAIVLAQAPAFPLLADAGASRAKQPLGRFLSKMHKMSGKAQPGTACAMWVNMDARRKRWKFWREQLQSPSESNTLINRDI